MKWKQIIAGLISGAMMLGCVGMMPEKPEVAQNITAQAADYVPRTTAPTSDNANYFSGNIFYTSGYGMPNCTCYAWGRAKELLGYNPPLCTRNAQYWYGYNDGFARGSEPKLGAIACWDHSGGGHVAVVEAIDGDTVWLSESSWGGDFFNYTSKNKNNMGNCGFSGGYFQGYIYIGDWSDTPQGHVMSEEEGAGQTIPDGEYWIYNEIDLDFGLDFVAGSDVEDGANAALCAWEDMPPEHDIWVVTYNGNGFYRIQQKNTDKFLDVSGGSLSSGTNVQAWTGNDSPAQEWSISKSTHGYKLRSRCNSFYLDVSGGVAESGRNVHVWTDNDTKAQFWCFVPANPEPIVKDGIYRIQSAVGDSCYLDAEGIRSDGYNEGANIQIWDSEGDDYFKITYDKDGYYYISEVTSGLVLDIDLSDANYLDNSRNIALYGKAYQRNKLWCFRDEGNGYYNIMSKLNGYTADLAVGEVDVAPENGTTVHQYPYHGNLNQQWKLIPYEEPTTETTTEMTTTTPETTTAETTTEETTTTTTTEEKIPDTRPSETTTTPVKPDRMYCDANDDGVIDIMDVIVLNKYLLGAGELTNTGKKNSDTNADGYLDTTDSLNIIKRVVELLSDKEFPVK